MRWCACDCARAWDCDCDFNMQHIMTDILQSSGTCPQGVTTCSGVIDLDVTSDDAVITINQKDTND